MMIILDVDTRTGTPCYVEYSIEEGEGCGVRRKEATRFTENEAILVRRILYMNGFPEGTLFIVEENHKSTWKK